MTGACHPLIICPDKDRWQVWCKPCGWQSSVFDARSWAQAAAQQHAPERP